MTTKYKEYKITKPNHVDIEYRIYHPNHYFGNEPIQICLTLKESKEYIDRLEKDKTIRNFVKYYSIDDLTKSIKLSEKNGDMDCNFENKKEALKILLENEKKSLLWSI